MASLGEFSTRSLPCRHQRPHPAADQGLATAPATGPPTDRPVGASRRAGASLLPHHRPAGRARRGIGATRRGCSKRFFQAPGRRSGGNRPGPASPMKMPARCRTYRHLLQQHAKPVGPARETGIQAAAPAATTPGNPAKAPDRRAPERLHVIEASHADRCEQAFALCCIRFPEVSQAILPAKRQ